MTDKNMLVTMDTNRGAFLTRQVQDHARTAIMVKQPTGLLDVEVRVSANGAIRVTAESGRAGADPVVLFDGVVLASRSTDSGYQTIEVREVATEKVTPEMAADVDYQRGRRWGKQHGMNFNNADTLNRLKNGNESFRAGYLDGLDSAHREMIAEANKLLAIVRDLPPS